MNNLVPMTMHHGRCHWSRALCQVSGRACSCKKDPCCDCLPLRVLIIVFVCLLLFLLLLLLFFDFWNAFVFREEVYDSQDIKLPIQFMVGVIRITLVSLVGASSISSLVWGKSAVIQSPVPFLTFIIV